MSRSASRWNVRHRWKISPFIYKRIKLFWFLIVKAIIKEGILRWNSFNKLPQGGGLTWDSLDRSLRTAKNTRWAIQRKRWTSEPLGWERPTAAVQSSGQYLSSSLAASLSQRLSGIRGQLDEPLVGGSTGRRGRSRGRGGPTTPGGHSSNINNDAVEKLDIPWNGRKLNVAKFAWKTSGRTRELGSTYQ